MYAKFTYDGPLGLEGVSYIKNVFAWRAVSSEHFNNLVEV